MSDDHPSNGGSFGALELVTLGGFLLGCIVAGVVAGLLLDGWLDTSPVFAFTGTMVGIAAAGVGFWLRVRTFLRG